MNQKNIVRILIALVLAAGLYFGFRYFTKPQTAVGTKTVTLIFIDTEGNQIDKKTVKSNAELLSELLLELKSSDFEVTLSGSASDPYGRSIETLGDYTTEDWAAGPWWVYDSDNNKECLEAGYCTGVDFLPIHDGDIFTFTFTDSFE